MDESVLVPAFPVNSDPPQSDFDEAMGSIAERNRAFLTASGLSRVAPIWLRRVRADDAQPVETKGWACYFEDRLHWEPDNSVSGIEGLDIDWGWVFNVTARSASEGRKYIEVGFVKSNASGKDDGAGNMAYVTLGFTHDPTGHGALQHFYRMVGVGSSVHPNMNQGGALPQNPEEEQERWKLLSEFAWYLEDGEHISTVVPVEMEGGYRTALTTDRRVMFVGDSSTGSYVSIPWLDLERGHTPDTYYPLHGRVELNFLDDRAPVTLTCAFLDSAAFTPPTSNHPGADPTWISFRMDEYFRQGHDVRFAPRMRKPEPANEPPPAQRAVRSSVDHEGSIPASIPSGFLPLLTAADAGNVAYLKASLDVSGKDVSKAWQLLDAAKAYLMDDEVQAHAAYATDVAVEGLFAERSEDPFRMAPGGRLPMLAVVGMHAAYGWGIATCEKSWGWSEPGLSCLAAVYAVLHLPSEMGLQGAQMLDVPLALEGRRMGYTIGRSQ